MSEYIEPYDLPEENEQRKLHLERYSFANLHLRGNVVANAACSTNYGAKLLWRPQRLIVGFDRNKKALAVAHKNGRLPVSEMDIEGYDFDGFDSMVCLETFEHLERPWSFLRDLSYTIKELVLSTPIIPTKYINEYHLHDFTKDEVLNGLREQGWDIIHTLIQQEMVRETYILIYATR